MYVFTVNSKLTEVQIWRSSWPNPPRSNEPGAMLAEDESRSNGPPGWQNLSSLAKLFCFIGHLAEIVELQSVANRKKLPGMSTRMQQSTVLVLVCSIPA